MSKLGACGLACVVCSAMKKGECEGCVNKSCEIMTCVNEKKIEGCFECEDFPCDKDMFKHTRTRCFVTLRKELGHDQVVKCLEINESRGILYHSLDGSKGAYDLEDEKQVRDLLMKAVL